MQPWMFSCAEIMWIATGLTKLFEANWVQRAHKSSNSSEALSIFPKKSYDTSDPMKPDRPELAAGVLNALGEAKMEERRLTWREQYEKEQAWGILSSIDIRGCKKERMTDESVVRDFAADLCGHIDMKA